MTKLDKNFINKIFLVILILILFYNLFHIGNYIRESHTNRKLHEQIKDNYHAKEGSYNPDLDEKLGLMGQIDPDPLDKFKPLLKINDQIKGWILIENTNIDYPVVLANDNEYYLNHNINKERSKAGSIFMDYRNEGNYNDKNIILYGHNMKDGSMFKGLMGYKNEKYFFDHPLITFSTLYETNQWEVFSAYVTKTDFDYIQTEFPNNEGYENFLKNISCKSLYETNVHVEADDIILTLSTCSYEFPNARFVVHAKKID